MRMQQYYYPDSVKQKWYFLCFVFLLVACTSGPSLTTSSPTARKSVLSQPAPLSSPPSVSQTCQLTLFAPAQGSQLPEAQGKAVHAEVWVLFFADPRSLQSGKEVKIVWRMTGSGTLQVVAHHAGNVQVRPVWGPDEHGGSSWNRPGAEWGTGFKFPARGCWDLHATRGVAAGDVWVTVQ